LTTFGRRILRSRLSLLALLVIDFEFVVFVVVVFFSSVVVSDEVCLTVLSLSFSVGSDVASCCVSLLSSVVIVVDVVIVTPSFGCSRVLNVSGQSFYH